MTTQEEAAAALAMAAGVEADGSLSGGEQESGEEEEATGVVAGGTDENVLTALTTLTNAVARLQSQMNDLEGQRSPRRRMMSPVRTSRDGPPGISTGPAVKERIPLSQIRNVDKCGVFSGKPLTYFTWSSKLWSTLNDEPGLKRLIKWAIEQKNDITMEELRRYDGEGLQQDPEVYSNQLYSLLMTITSDVPLLMVLNTTGDNGLQAMRKLHHAYALITAQARRKLIQQLLHPKQARTYEEVLGHQEQWEQIRCRYEEATNSTLPDDVLIVGYSALLPNKLQEDLLSLDRDFTKLAEVPFKFDENIHDKLALGDDQILVVENWYSAE